MPSGITQSELAYQLIGGKAKNALMEYRSIPRQSNRIVPDSPEWQLLYQMLIRGDMDYPRMNRSTADYLIRSFYLTLTNGTIRFPSPIVADIALQLLYRTSPASSCTDCRLVGLDQFVRWAVSNIIHQNLIRSQSTGIDHYERQLQMEFYRACCCIVPAYRVSADVGRHFNSSGYVDFYIGQARWAIEITRNSNKLEEYIHRFHTDSIYAMIPMNAWLVADFVQKNNLQNVENDPAPVGDRENVWTVYWCYDSHYIRLFKGHDDLGKLVVN